MKEASDWLTFIAGLILGGLIGGSLVYAIMLRDAQTLIKTFAYDEAGRLIQVMKERGV